MVLMVIALGKGVFMCMYVQENKVAETEGEISSKQSS